MTTVNAAFDITRSLRQIIDDQPASIRAYVAQEALNYHVGDPAQMFMDLSRYGCQCGHIDSLVWYSQTHAFFDRHYDEIEELREEYEDSLGKPLRIQGDLKNWLAWFAFEEVAFRMADKLGLEI